MLMTSLFWSSCNIINPEEEIPTYLRIDSISVEDENGVPISSKITGASVSYSNSSAVNLVGVFRLPMYIPVLADMDGEVIILPSIDVDASPYNLITYPFLAKITKEFPMKPGDTVNLGTLKTKYLSNFTEKLDEDFEQGGISMDIDPDSLAEWSPETTIVRDGDYSGKFEVHGTQKVTYFVIPKDLLLRFNKQTYIELDYRGNVDMGIVLMYIEQGSTLFKEYGLLGLRQKDDWNKAYINITDNIGSIGETTYRLGFKVIREATDPDAVFYLDNIKILVEK